MISRQLPNTEESRMQIKQTGQLLWNAGLPVLDDLHNVSYGFPYPKDKNLSDDQLRKFATSRYRETIAELKPGLTMVIMHCTAPSEIFPNITDSGRIRKGDLLAMTDPEFKKFLENEKIVLTTWREVKERRAKIK
jgi:hypothetical protein